MLKELDCVELTSAMPSDGLLSDDVGTIVQRIGTTGAKQTRLAERFGLVSLALVGSMARDAANLHSDIDILVGFNGPATSDRFFGVLTGRR